jgi:hypothetical protein
MMAAVLKFIFEPHPPRRRVVWQFDIRGKRASVEYRRASYRECIKAVTILTPSFAAALCVSN